MLDALTLSYGLLPQQTHGIFLREHCQVLHDSSSLGWRGLYAALVNERPWKDVLPSGCMAGLVYCVNAGTRVRRTYRNVTAAHVLQPRHFSVLPSDAGSFWEVEDHPQVLHLYVHPELLDRAAQTLFAVGGGGANQALLPRFCVHDTMIDGLVNLVVQMLQEAQPQSALLADHVAALLAMRLLSHHSHWGSAAPERAMVPHYLPERVWQRVLDLIEADVAADLSVKRMSQIAGVDASHLWRAFRVRLQTSPHQYVLQRRLDCARQLLAQGEMPIAEVALAAGFSSQSHLGHAFKKQWGQTPAQYQRSLRY